MLPLPVPSGFIVNDSLYRVRHSFFLKLRVGDELLLLGGKSNQKRLCALVATIPPLSYTEPSNR